MPGRGSLSPPTFFGGAVVGPCAVDVPAHTPGQSPGGIAGGKPPVPVSYDDKNVFARILRKEIPAQVLHEDHLCLAFRDVAPQAPTHFLVIPKRPVAKLADAGAEDKAMLGHLLWAAAEVARQLGVTNDGFRVVINNGARANQTVFHLHVHVLAGRDMKWPPG